MIEVTEYDLLGPYGEVLAHIVESVDRARGVGTRHITYVRPPLSDVVINMDETWKSTKEEIA